MTKARDLANIISGSGTLNSSVIPNLDASKITTGTFADARISNSSVSQHATSFDDNKLVNDISTLALRQASNENKVGYNTNSMSIDVFQDNTKLILQQTQYSFREYNGSIFESEAVSPTIFDWTANRTS